MKPTVSLGVTNEDMESGSYYDCSPCCKPCGGDDAEAKAELEKWRKTLVYPELTVKGMHAELMGADDLNVDDVVEVTLKLKVKSKRDDSRRVEGEKQVKRDICIGFCILATSNLTDRGTEKADAGGESEMEGGEMGAGMMMDSEDAAPVRALLGG